MDYSNVLVLIGLGVLAIAAGAGLLYGNFAKWRKWRSANPPRSQAEVRRYDMRREGQRLSAE